MALGTGALMGGAAAGAGTEGAAGGAYGEGGYSAAAANEGGALGAGEVAGGAGTAASQGGGEFYEGGAEGSPSGGGEPGGNFYEGGAEGSPAGGSTSNTIPPEPKPTDFSDPAKYTLAKTAWDKLTADGMSGALGGAAKTAGALALLHDLIKGNKSPLEDATKHAMEDALSSTAAYANAPTPGLTDTQKQAIDYARTNAGGQQKYLDASQGYLADAAKPITKADIGALTDYSAPSGEGYIGQGGDLVARGALPTSAADIEALRDPRLKDSGRFLDSSYDLLTKGAGRVGQEDINAYLNPETEAVVSAALADMERQNAKQTNARNARAQMTGAFGGSRAVLEDKAAQDAYLRALGFTSAGLRKSAYDSAVTNAMKEREGQRASGGVLAGTGSNLAGLEQRGWEGAGALAGENRNAALRAGDTLMGRGSELSRIRQADRAAATGVVTGNRNRVGETGRATGALAPLWTSGYTGTVGALSDAGAMERAPALQDLEKKRQAAMLYSNTASGVANQMDRFAAPNTLGQVTGALTAAKSAKDLGLFG